MVRRLVAALEKVATSGSGSAASFSRKLETIRGEMMAVFVDLNGVFKKFF